MCITIHFSLLSISTHLKKKKKDIVIIKIHIAYVLPIHFYDVFAFCYGIEIFLKSKETIENHLLFFFFN